MQALRTFGAYLGTVPVSGMDVNVAADFVSLLETRFPLVQMHRFRRWQTHFLLCDLVLTAAIIWFALSKFQPTALHAQRTGGDGQDIGEVLPRALTAATNLGQSYPMLSKRNRPWRDDPIPEPVTAL